MPLPALSSSALSRNDALRELELEGVPPHSEISTAFRRKARSLNNTVTAADMEAALRRLIEARERLMADFAITETEFGFVERSSQPEPKYLDISLKDALTGGDIVRDIPTEDLPVPEQVRSFVTARIRLPAGLRSGEVVRLGAKYGGEVREHLFRITITGDQTLSVHGNDIWMVADVSAHTLRSGGRVTLDTPHGPVEVEIAEGCASGTCLTLKGLGLPATETRPAGNLNIRLEMERRHLSYSDRAATFRARWLSPHPA